MSAGYEKDLEMSVNPLIHTLGDGDLKSDNFVDDEVDFPSWPLANPYEYMINYKFTASQWAYLADEANFANINFLTTTITINLGQTAGDKVSGNIQDVRNRLAAVHCEHSDLCKKDNSNQYEADDNKSTIENAEFLLKSSNYEAMKKEYDETLKISDVRFGYTIIFHIIASILYLVSFVDPTWQVSTNSCNMSLYTNNGTGNPWPQATAKFYESIEYPTISQSKTWYLGAWKFSPQNGLCPLELPSGTSSKEEKEMFCISFDNPNSKEVFSTWDATNALFDPPVQSDMTKAWAKYSNFYTVGLVCTIYCALLLWGLICCPFEGFLELKHGGRLTGPASSDDSQSSRQKFVWAGQWSFIFYSMWSVFGIIMWNDLANSDFMNTTAWQPFFPGCNILLYSYNGYKCLIAACVSSFLGAILIFATIFDGYSKFERFKMVFIATEIKEYSPNELTYAAMVPKRDAILKKKIKLYNGYVKTMMALDRYLHDLYGKYYVAPILDENLKSRNIHYLGDPCKERITLSERIGVSRPRVFKCKANSNHPEMELYTGRIENYAASGGIIACDHCRKNIRYKDDTTTPIWHCKCGVNYCTQCVSSVSEEQHHFNHMDMVENTGVMTKDSTAVSAVNFCPTCGVKINDQSISNFCSSCGGNLSGSASTSVPVMATVMATAVRESQYFADADGTVPSYDESISKNTSLRPLSSNSTVNAYPSAPPLTEAYVVPIHDLE